MCDLLWVVLYSKARKTSASVNYYHAACGLVCWTCILDKILSYCNIYISKKKSLKCGGIMNLNGLARNVYKRKSAVHVG